MQKYIYTVSITFLSLLFLSFDFQNEKPTLYIIGDSTVKNGSGKGSDSLWGWGSVITPHFDTTKIHIENHAIGGRSSRTFITDGRWDKILKTLKAGDFVLMQFGHNDGAPLDDTARARGTLRGISDSSKTIYNPIRKVEETVYTFGWYMRKYIKEAKDKGAIPIVCSLVPRNQWDNNNKIRRSTDSYAQWAKQVANAESVAFLDLNEKIAVEYEKTNEPDIKNRFFPKDHTHTNLEGAKLNAQIVVTALHELKNCPLSLYLNAAK